jgi:hypothetical protein
MLGGELLNQEAFSLERFCSTGFGKKEDSSRWIESNKI